MHKAWPELLKKMRANKATTTAKERQLVISARTWFCLYLFEHQSVLSFRVTCAGGHSILILFLAMTAVQDVIWDRPARDSEG